MPVIKEIAERQLTVENEQLLQAVEEALPTKTVTLITERGHTHGNYNNTARYIQQLKNIAYRAYNERSQRGQPALTPQQKESLEMILHKVGRILSGDPSFQDHWDDIGGYAHIANKEF